MGVKRKISLTEKEMPRALEQMIEATAKSFLRKEGIQPMQSLATKVSLDNLTLRMANVGARKNELTFESITLEPTTKEEVRYNIKEPSNNYGLEINSTGITLYSASHPELIIDEPGLAVKKIELLYEGGSA